jgi:hypothetical protein
MTVPQRIHADDARDDMAMGDIGKGKTQKIRKICPKKHPLRELKAYPVQCIKKNRRLLDALS